MTFEKLTKLLEERGAILFGSRAFNCADIKSDYDYVLPLIQAEALKAQLQERIANNYTVSENNYYVSGYYVSFLDGKIINITGCKQEDFEAWRSATDMLKGLGYAIRRIDAKSRKMLFETNLSILKNILRG